MVTDALSMTKRAKLQVSSLSLLGRGDTKFLLKPQFESFCPHCVSSGSQAASVLYITSSQLFTAKILERE